MTSDLDPPKVIKIAIRMLVLYESTIPKKIDANSIQNHVESHDSYNPNYYIGPKIEKIKSNQLGRMRSSNLGSSYVSILNFTFI